MPSVLIVDDEDGMRRSLAILFRKEGYRVSQAASGEEALSLLGSGDFDLLITDLRMDGMSGLDLLGRARELQAQVPVIIMTGYGTIDSAVTAMKMGAYDYISKPFEYDEILHRARKAIQSTRTNREIALMRQDYPPAGGSDFSMVIGQSRTIQEVRTQLGKISRSDLPVLITGETGTGKNLIAKAIHLNGSRAGGPFVPVNCTSVPEHLFESELFGHTKGAFTGAVMDRRGLFETANHGTILLDELGAMPKTVQAKLLGVLQDKRVRKVGSDQEILIDVRVIAATNTDLPTSIRKGEFREDLFYRINVLHLHIPPLREHREDIPLLAERFLSLCAASQNKTDITGFAPGTIEMLYRYDYPGNVRELFNMICHAVAVSDAGLIRSEDIPAPVPDLPACPSAGAAVPPMDIREWEKKVILQSIERHPNNLAEVCKELKIGRTTLWRKMKRYKIDVASLRKVSS